MSTPNKIIFSTDNYESKEVMFKEIGEFIRLVSDAGYVCKTRYDEPGLGIFVVEFDYDNVEFANNFLTWLTYDEMEYLETMADCEDNNDIDNENDSGEVYKPNYNKYVEETKKIYGIIE